MARNQDTAVENEVMEAEDHDGPVQLPQDDEEPAQLPQDDYRREVSALVEKLLALGLTPQEISERLDHRVSARTIYRWANQESVPHNQSDYRALVELAERNGT